MLVIDCQVAGLSGDMMLGALVDLGANMEKMVAAIKSLEGVAGCRNLKVEIKEVKRRGFRAKKVEIKADEPNRLDGSTLIGEVQNSARHLNLSAKAQNLALRTVKTLVETEAKLHGENVEAVHLHEAGSIDTLADILGSTVALEDLGLLDAQIYSTPIAVGGGSFTFSHGIVSSPAPAVVEMLASKGFLMLGGPVDSELTTPTGAAILTNIASGVTPFYPLIKPEAVGYGAGTKDFDQMPNVLRLVLGEQYGHKLLTEDIYELETNVDDVTGEVIAYTMERLFREGAKDVSIIPMYTKKNRPGHIIKVIASSTDASRLSMILMLETGSLGVRVYPSVRHILNREIVKIEVEIEGKKETVGVKVARDKDGKIFQLKPEYEDLSKLAEKLGKPIRDLEHEVRSATLEYLHGETIR